MRKRFSFSAAVLGSAALALALGGCASPGAGTESTDGAWTLVSMRNAGGDIDLHGATVTLNIGEQSGGQAPCNGYGVNITRSTGEITVDEIIHTEMACEDQRLMDVEVRYFELLDAATSASLDGDMLVLSSVDSELHFER